MSKKLYEESNIQGIANAIREKNGTQNSYTVAQMGNAVRAIHTDPILEALSVTENGNYLPSAGKDGFGSVSVNVEGEEPVIQPLSITQNGTYNPPSGVDGYAPLIINVASGEKNLTAYVKNDRVYDPTYIDTGYVHSRYTTYRLVAEIVNVDGQYSAFIGVRQTKGTDNNSAIIRCGWGNTKITGVCSYNGTIINGAERNDFLNKKCKYILSNLGLEGYAIFTSDAFMAQNSGQSPYITRNCFLFRANEADETTYGGVELKVYELMILEKDIIVHDFVAWKDELDVACVKDLVTNELKYPINGTLIYGTDN